MASVRIYLKLEADNSELGIVYAQVSHQGKRYTKSTGVKIPVKQWDEKRRKMKGTSQVTFNTNNTLEKIEKEINEVLLDNRKDFSIEKVKPLIDAVIAEEGLRTVAEIATEEPEDKEPTLLEYFDEFINKKDNEKVYNTKRRYNTLKNLLEEFCIASHQPVEFEVLDKRFGERFITYMMETKKLVNNTISKNLDNLRTFLKWCELERDVPVNKAYLKYRAPSHDVEPSYLTREELMQLYNTVFEHGRHDRVRDLFCFACWTGLRHSDVQELTKENIVNGKIRMTAIKTKEKISIPLNPYTIAILEKHDYKLPRMSNQKANEFLKEAAKIAGLDRVEKEIAFRGIERVETKLPLYDKISFHDGRRTFITLLKKEGVRDEVIRRMTGHKDLKSFQKYLGVTDDEPEEAMKNVWG